VTANSNNNYGINLRGDSNTLSNITANFNDYGVWIDGRSNILSNSTLQENNLNDIQAAAANDADCNNEYSSITISGNRTFGYYNYSVNLGNLTFSELILCDADGSNLTNITIDGSDSLDNNKLDLHRTENATLININSSNNYAGVYLERSNNNTLYNITANSNSYGIYILSISNGNKLINLHLSESSTTGIHFISNPAHNKIFNALITDTPRGIRLDGYNNTFEFVTINDTTTDAILVSDSAVNVTLRNILITNCAGDGIDNSVLSNGTVVSYIANYSCANNGAINITNQINLSFDPYDHRASNGDYYLNQTSFAVDNGSATAANSIAPTGAFALDTYFTTDSQDLGTVDIGYHYPNFAEGLPFDSCSILGVAGKTYTLLNNISQPTIPSNGVCMNITANDVTLDCDGLIIDGSDDGWGVWAEDVTGITIKNCTFSNWGDGGDEAGIYFTQVGNSTIEDVNASQNRNGIFLDSNSDYNNLTGVTANSNSPYGIRMDSSSYHTISNVTADSNSIHGFYFVTSSSNTMSNITANSNSNSGIRFLLGGSTNLSDVTVNSNQYGVYLASSDSNIMSNLTAESNSNSGVYLDGSESNTLSNSTLQENTQYDFFIAATQDSECNNKIVNTTGSGNRPIEYYNYSVELEKRTFSQLILCNADNSNLTNITIISSDSINNNLLYLLRTSDANLTNINSSYNYYGVYLETSSSNTLTNITVNNNSQSGIFLFSNSDSNTISNVTANYNTNGVYLSSADSNILSDITANSNSQYGIELQSSDLNDLMNIYSSNSTTAGIYLLSSTDNNNIFNALITDTATGIRLDGTNNIVEFVTINGTTTDAIETADFNVNATVRNVLIAYCSGDGIDNTAGATELDLSYIANFSCTNNAEVNVNITNQINLSFDPYDRRATNGGYYLNQTSFAVDNGSDTATNSISPDSSFAMDTYYTAAFTDSGTVDIGYHYPVAAAGLPAPTLHTNYTVPTYPRKDDNVTFVVNVTDDATITSVNFTIINPSGTKVVENLNGFNNGDNNWNISYNISSYGTWLWNVSVYNSDQSITRSDTIEIILMELTINLNDSSSLAGAPDSINVYGHINLSNGTLVNNTFVNFYINGTLNSSTNLTDNFGNYSINFTAPSVSGTYEIRINTTFGNNISGENTISLVVTAAGNVNYNLPLFEIRDNQDNRLAIFDSFGNLDIIGTLTQNTEPTADDNDFIIQNLTQGLNAVITNPQGNLLIKQTIQQNLGTLSPTLNAFIIQNNTGTSVAYFNSTGSLFLVGSLTEQVSFD